MLTENEMKIWSLVWKHGGHSNFVPFILRNGRVLLKLNQHRRYAILLCIVLFAMLFYKLIVLRAALRKRDINGAILQSIFVLINCGTFLATINLFLFKERLVELVNPLLHCNSAWGRKFFCREYAPASKIREKAFAISLMAIIVIAIAAWLTLALTVIRTGLYVNDFLPLLQFLCNCRTFTALVYLSIEAALLFDGLCKMMITVCMLYLCCFSTNFWLHKICIYWPASKPRHTSSMESLISMCITYYRGIYMLNDSSNLAFGKLLIPCLKLILLFGLIVSCFAIIRLRADLNAISSLLMAGTLIGSVILMVPFSIVVSSTYQISKRMKHVIFPLVQEVTNLKTRALFERQLRSCSLIRCKVGNMYHMEARAKLTMLDHTVSGLVFLLVKSKR